MLSIVVCLHDSSMIKKSYVDNIQSILTLMFKKIVSKIKCYVILSSLEVNYGHFVFFKLPLELTFFSSCCCNSFCLAICTVGVCDRSDDRFDDCRCRICLNCVTESVENWQLNNQMLILTGSNLPKLF